MLSENDFEMLLVSSTRYALGRRSYIVGWTNDVINAHVPTIREPTLVTILKDIEWADDKGMEQDKQNWEKTYSIIYNEIKEREKTQNDNTGKKTTNRRRKKAVSIR